MKNLQIIKQRSGALSVSKDIATIRKIFQAGAYLLSAGNMGYNLDGIHKLQKGDNALIIISQEDNRKHSLVICSQGGFFDDQMVWSGEDIKSLQAAVATLQNTKQNVTDATLSTQTKSVAGAINELFGGGVKDKSIDASKLAQSIQDTLGRVGMNLKVLPKGTDLTSTTLEDGVWLVTDPNSYAFPPSWFSGNSIAVLIVNKASNNVIMIGHDGSFNELPAWASRFLSSTSWRGAGKKLEEIFAKKSEMSSAIDTLVECVEFTKTTLSNKAHLDAYLAKVPNAKVMNCTYNGGYAGTLHKINGSWYGVLVSESNTLAGQLSIKLQADGTIVEGTA